MTTIAPASAITLPRWQRNAIYACTGALTLTGIAWLLLPDAETSEAARWMLRLHGVAAYALLVAAGSVLPVHLKLGWIRRRNRWSGSLLVALLAALAATGLWLYYGSLASHGATSIAHWIGGLALPVWVVLHRAWGLRSRARGS